MTSKLRESDLLLIAALQELRTMNQSSNGITGRSFVATYFMVDGRQTSEEFTASDMTEAQRYIDGRVCTRHTSQTMTGGTEVDNFETFIIEHSSDYSEIVVRSQIVTVGVTTTP